MLTVETKGFDCHEKHSEIFLKKSKHVSNATCYHFLSTFYWGDLMLIMNMSTEINSQEWCL